MSTKVDTAIEQVKAKEQQRCVKICTTYLKETVKLGMDDTTYILKIILEEILEVK